jgi:hypothetical protein|tara:strand:+ start:444 stop:629 length:186 start_codon:yes stop_codon:yes gene_type:complete
MDKLIAHFGNQKKLADFLDVKHGHIYYWLKNGIPPRVAIKIEEKTDGLFNRRLLCPEFFNQ